MQSDNRILQGTKTETRKSALQVIKISVHQAACFRRKKVEHGLFFTEFKNRVAVKPTRFHRVQYSN